MAGICSNGPSQATLNAVEHRYAAILYSIHRNPISSGSLQHACNVTGKEPPTSWVALSSRSFREGANCLSLTVLVVCQVLRPRDLVKKNNQVWEMVLP